MSQTISIELKKKSEFPIYRQIYKRFIVLIQNNILKSGERVPSIRSLASELGVAKGSVEYAYDLLIGEGYLEARGQAGTIVALDLKNILNALRKNRVSTEEVPDITFNASSMRSKIRPLQMGWDKTKK